MILDKYRALYKAVNSKFRVSNNGNTTPVPLWSEKFLLRNLKSKKIRIRKKVLKKQFKAMSKKSGFVLVNFYLGK